MSNTLLVLDWVDSWKYGFRRARVGVWVDMDTSRGCVRDSDRQAAATAVLFICICKLFVAKATQYRYRRAYLHLDFTSESWCDVHWHLASCTVHLFSYKNNCHNLISCARWLTLTRRNKTIACLKKSTGLSRPPRHHVQPRLERSQTSFSTHHITSHHSWTERSRRHALAQLDKNVIVN